jgi:hypothetical protein
VEVDESMSPLRKSAFYQLELFFYGRTCHCSQDGYGHFKANTIQRSTFNRTIHIMRKQGLVTYIQIPDWFDIRLTEKGKDLAIILEKEARKYIEDFSFLLD